MNIPNNLLKSTLLATLIFWTINFTEEMDINYVPIVILSIIPIFICCAITITLTICPIFWLLENEKMSKKRIFKTCFPIYSIIAFSLCAKSIYTIQSEIFFISFLITAYITTAQSWVWFAKEK